MSLVDHDHLIPKQKDIDDDNDAVHNLNLYNDIRNSGSMTTTLRKSFRTLTRRKTADTATLSETATTITTTTTSRQRFDSTNSNSKLIQHRRHSSSSFEQQLYEPHLPNNDDLIINKDDHDELFPSPAKPFDRIAYRIRKSFRSMGRQTKNVLGNSQRNSEGGRRSRLESNNSNKRLLTKTQSSDDLNDQSTTIDKNEKDISLSQNISNHQEIKVAISSTMPLTMGNINDEQNKKTQRRRAPQAPKMQLVTPTVAMSNDQKPISTPNQLSTTRTRLCDESGYSSLSEPTNSERSSVNSVNKQKNKKFNRSLRIRVSFLLKKRQSSLTNENLLQQQQISSDGKKSNTMNMNNHVLLTLSPSIDEEDNNIIHYNDDENIIVNSNDNVDQPTKKTKLSIGKRFQTLRRSFIGNKRRILE
ncbi:unnamed protein product [Didymodactylos carnosus]|uniref:Uncharacterized protein n=1 Tax=Didymodactylos carnosus TaxID=1234261 RepID=A0A813ZU49_9BILA|nr:unnamed protein product [Didymodactylos carnosus]CAF0932212.1 unnamed protein product [Didymodactylos carnosus]CAF3686101.1 unnamed protein product [Didymodactylos carnosus]CAF3708587.1 unnamed protein product [Didymodactylos carnosus]